MQQVNDLERWRWPDVMRCHSLRQYVRGGVRAAAGRREMPRSGASVIGDGGDDRASHADPAAAVVRGDVADDQSEARGVGEARVQRSLGWGPDQTVWAMLHVIGWRWSVPVVSAWRVTSRSTRRMSAGSGATLRDAGPRPAPSSRSLWRSRTAPGISSGSRLRHVPEVSCRELAPDLDEAEAGRAFTPRAE